MKDVLVAAKLLMASLGLSLTIYQPNEKDLHLCVLFLIFHSSGLNLRFLHRSQKAICYENEKSKSIPQDDP